MKHVLWLLLVLAPLLMMPGGSQAQTDITCADLGQEDAPASYFVGLGDAYLDQGNYARTILAYTCAVERDPNYAPAYMHRGLAYSFQGANGAAMDDYNRALTINETLIAAYNNRGMLYLTEGNFGLALTDFDLAVALDPTFAVGYHNRGLVHAAEGNYDLALADFQQAISLDPNYAAPYASIGAVYSAMSLQSYQRYQEVAGPTQALPGGRPGLILDSLDSSLDTGSFSVWLSFLTPAR